MPFCCLFLFRPCRVSPLPTHAHFIAFVIPPSSFCFAHTRRRFLFLPSVFLFLRYAHICEQARNIFALSSSFSYTHARRRCVEKQNMRMPRYYVMPTDCGSDILCMLMPHNVGFVPLFSIYLFGSPSHGRFCRERGHDVMFVPGITVSRSISSSNS